MGKPREFGFPIKDHVQLGKDLDILDFDAASEVIFKSHFFSYLVILLEKRSPTINIYKSFVKYAF